MTYKGLSVFSKHYLQYLQIHLVHLDQSMICFLQLKCSIKINCLVSDELICN
ncbi:hypothetical protein HanIR_Chr05g0233671 [Helianthus annuus]|nr:hypothetical protein HanIR_Chr05g0233671 [Helianthus annuus]